MKVYALVSAVLLGVAVPLVTNLASPAAAQPLENTPVVPLSGSFGDSNWMVTVTQEDGRYRYLGYDYKKNKSIELIGAKVTNQGGKRLYTWHNGDTKYRVTWQPQDQDYVRLQVISPNRKEVLNRLLSRQEEGCSH
jgi:hypothetical protein